MATDTRTLIERTRETLKEQRDYWEAVHDRQTTATPEYNTAIAIIASIDEQDAALRDLIAALPQAQEMETCPYCEGSGEGGAPFQKCGYCEGRGGVRTAAPPAPDARLDDQQTLDRLYAATDCQCDPDVGDHVDWCDLAALQRIHKAAKEASLRAHEGEK